MIEAEPMAVPLRQTPAAFRWWWVAVLLVGVATQLAIAREAPGLSLWEVLHTPGAVVLLILVVVAEVYPALPSMQKSDPFEDYVLSTPLVIAALVAFGPHAAAFFVVAGLVMSIPFGMVWWRVVLNVALWALQGAAAAGVLWLVMVTFDLGTPMTSAVMVPVAFLLAIVVEGLNVVLVMTSKVLARATSIRGYSSDWRRQAAIASLALTAPIPAVLAVAQPALLPLLAIAMVAAQSGMSAVSSRTALAGTDPLTSIANRDRLLSLLRPRLGRLRENRETVTLLLADVDHFKQVNDDRGHLAGDMVLVEVARRLEEATRADDVVARYGGDEFGILLAGTVPQSTLDEVILRVRRTVARPLVLNDESFVVSVSIGAAVVDRRGVEPLRLIELADAALYEAKMSRPVAVGASAGDATVFAPSPSGPVPSRPGASDAVASDAVPFGPVDVGRSPRSMEPVWAVTSWDPAWSVTQPQRSE